MERRFVLDFCALSRPDPSHRQLENHPGAILLPLESGAERRVPRPENANGGRGSYLVIRLRFKKAFTSCSSCFAGAAVSIGVQKYSGHRFARDFFRFCVLKVTAHEKNKAVKRERGPVRPWGVLDGFGQGAGGRERKVL